MDRIYAALLHFITYVKSIEWNVLLQLRQQSYEHVSAKLWSLVFFVRSWSSTFQTSQEENYCIFGQKGWWKNSSLIHFLCTSFSVFQFHFCLQFLLYFLLGYSCFRATSGLQMKPDFQTCLMTWHPGIISWSSNLLLLEIWLSE